MCQSGIYIVRFDENCIKIGRSKDIAKRLKQYAGYRAKAAQVEKILLVYTRNYKELEKASHQFAEDYGLPRYKPHEVFECSLAKTAGFIEGYRDFLDIHHREDIHSIADRFECEEPREPYTLPPESNVRA